MTVAGKAATVRSSSTLPSKTPGRYSVANLFDGKLDTAWVEGAPGPGNEEWVEIEFDEPAEIDGYLIAPGYGKSRDVFLQNAVPYSVEVRSERRRLGEHDLRYPMDFGCVWTGEPSSWGPRVVVLENPATVKTLRLVISKGIWSDAMRTLDLAISEFRPILVGQPAEAAAPDEWKRLVHFTTELVRSLRTRAFDRRLLAPNAEVDDVFEPARNDPKGHGPVLEGSLESVGAAPGRSRIENFETVAGGGYINSAVTILRRDGDVALIGEHLFNIGTEEYGKVEIDTVLRLVPTGDSFKVRQMRFIVESSKCNRKILPDPDGPR
jgi:hypothetical protein